MSNKTLLTNVLTKLEQVKENQIPLETVIQYIKAELMLDNLKTEKGASHLSKIKLCQKWLDKNNKEEYHKAWELENTCDNEQYMIFNNGVFGVILNEKIEEIDTFTVPAENPKIYEKRLDMHQFCIDNYEYIVPVDLADVKTAIDVCKSIKKATKNKLLFPIININGKCYNAEYLLTLAKILDIKQTIEITYHKELVCEYIKAPAGIGIVCPVKADNSHHEVNNETIQEFSCDIE